MQLRLQPVRPGWGIVYMAGTAITLATPWPWLDACLALHKLGKRGDVELWDYVRPYPLRSGSVEEAWRERYRPQAIKEGDHRSEPRHYQDAKIKPGTSVRRTEDERRARSNHMARRRRMLAHGGLL